MGRWQKTELTWEAADSKALHEDAQLLLLSTEVTQTLLEMLESQITVSRIFNRDERTVLLCRWGQASL